MAGYNRVIMIGNLTRDPDYKQLTSGQSVCRLGLATNRQFKNRQTGAMVQEVCYVDIDVWGAQAESCRQYLQKGRAILVEGRLKFDSWEDPNGQTRSKLSIVADRVVFLSSASAEFGGDVAAQQRDAGKDRLDPNNAQEKELLDQIDQIKARAQDKKAPAVKAAVRADDAADKPKKAATKSDAPAAAKKTSDTGEIAFKDEPPFQDDLPF